MHILFKSNDKTTEWLPSIHGHIATENSGEYKNSKIKKC